jgi:Protein of unknown function (DUF4231)
MTENEYISERLDDQIEWYSDRSSKCQLKYKTLRVCEICAAAVIPFLSGMTGYGDCVRFSIGLLGVAIAISGGVGALFRYHENWIQYRVTSEQLKHEKYMFLTSSGPYENCEFRVLVQRVEALISKEAVTWAQVSKQSSSSAKK